MTLGPDYAVFLDQELYMLIDDLDPAAGLEGGSRDFRRGRLHECVRIAVRFGVVTQAEADRRIEAGEIY